MNDAGWNSRATFRRDGTRDEIAGSEPLNFTEITLDAARLHGTLDMLEGVAAEGKGWVSEERERGEMLTT